MIGVFIGSFNPITAGHVFIAESMLKHSACTHVMFVPVSDLYQKDTLDFTADQRIKGNTTYKIIEVIASALKNIEGLPSDKQNLLKQQLANFHGDNFIDTTTSICNLTDIKHFYTTGSVSIIYKAILSLMLPE